MIDNKGDFFDITTLIESVYVSSMITVSLIVWDI